MEYASKSVGGTGLGLGIAGTSLGVLNALGGAASLFGIGGNRQPQDPGDRPVTRYEMGLHQEINDKKIEIAELKSNRYTDFVANGLQQQISGQAVWNATQTAGLSNLQGQIAQLQSVTKLMIPNENLAPGYGRSAVMPVSSLPPYFVPYPLPPISGGDTGTVAKTTDSTSGS